MDFIKVTGISMVVGALITISKNLEKRLSELDTRRRIVSIQITARLESPKISILECLMYSDFSENHQLQLVWKTRKGQ